MILKERPLTGQNAATVSASSLEPPCRARYGPQPRNPSGQRKLSLGAGT